MGMSLFVKTISFILLPIYASVLTVEDYGKLATIESLLRFAPVVFSLSIESSIYRYYHDKSTCNGKLISTSILFILLNSFTMTIIAYILIYSGKIPKIHNYEYILILTAISSCIAQISIIFIAELKAKVLAKDVAIYTSVLSIVAFLFTIYFLYVFNVSWLSRLYAYLVAVIVQLICLIVFFKREPILINRPSFNILKKQLKYSLPLFPSVISIWALALFDRLYLQYLGMPESVGIYSMAVQIALIMYIVQDSILQVNSPKLMKSLINSTLNKVEQKKFFERFIVFLLGLNLFVAFFQEYAFMIFMSPQYYESMIYIPFLMFMHILRGWNRYIYVYLSFENRTSYIGILGIFQVIVIGLLNYFYFPVYGVKFTIFSSGIVLLSVTLLLAKDFLKYGIDVNFRKIFLATALIGMCSIVSIFHSYSVDYKFDLIVFFIKILSLFSLILIFYYIFWKRR